METILIVLLVLFLLGGGGWGFSRLRRELALSWRQETDAIANR